MNARRKFLQQTTLLATGGFILQNNSFANRLFSTPNLPAPGIQLFTLFNEMDIDTIGTLQKVAKAGYVNIESAFSKQGNFYGNKPKEFKQLLSNMGMKWRSHHVMGTPLKLPPNYKLPTGPDGKPISFPVMKNLKEHGQEIVDHVAEAEIEYLVCASINIETGDDIKKSAEVLQIVGEMAKKAGMQFVYHNHTNEFTVTDGIVSYDYFTTQISTDILKMELDLGWVFKAGKNPVDLFKKNKGRFPLLHVKDIDANGNIVPFGTGVYNFKDTFENVKIAGMKYYFLEQDFPKHPFEDIITATHNFENFKKTL